MFGGMEGIKGKQELSNEFNHPLKNETKQERLELGFQSLDFGDQTLNHELIGAQEDGLSKKLSEMTVEGFSGEEEGPELMFAIETEGGFDEGGNFGGEIGGESDQGGLGGFKDGGAEVEGGIEERGPGKSVVEGNEGDFEGVNKGGGDELGSKMYENENRVGDCDLKGFINDEAKIEERKSGKLGVVEANEGDFEGVKERGGDKEGIKWCENENRGGDHDLEGFINDEAKLEERGGGKFNMLEGYEGDFTEMKEGGKDEGNTWSEIENEGGDHDLEGIKDEAKIDERNPEKCSAMEGNEGDSKETKEEDNDKEGSKWSEIENEGGDRDLEGIKDEAEIEERNPEKGSLVERNEGSFEHMKKGGSDKKGSKWSEIENEGGRDLKGIKDEAKIEVRNPEKHSVVEGNEGAFKEMKEGGSDKEGSKWSEIENEGDLDLKGIKDEAKIEERNPLKLSVLEGNEGAFKEMNEGGNDKEGSKWIEIENEGGDRDLDGIKDEAKIEERNPEKHSLVEENEGDFKEVKDGGNDEGSKWGENEDVEESYNLEVKNKRADKRKEVIEHDEDGWGESEDVEETYTIEVKNKRADKGKEVIEDYADGWGEGWGENCDDGAVRAEANQEKQYFDNYENERNVNEQYGEVPHWYGNAEGDVVGRNVKMQYDKEPQWYSNAEKDSGGSNDGNFGSRHYPLRPDAQDCSFYMRTGTCRFGSNCKFNHPLKRENQAAKDTFKQKEEIYDKPRKTECKYYLSSGGCKYGKACRYNHGKGKAAVTPNIELNFIGLPIRVGEKECAFYMRTGSCKYGPNCKFHHPDPTATGGGDTTSPGRGSSSARTLNETAPFRPVIYPPTPSAPQNAEWNGYQAPAYQTSQSSLPIPPAISMTAYQTSQRNLPIPPAISMNTPATGSSFHAHPHGQVIVDEYPERPGQPLCNFYMKTGNCKYKSTCKFHHPKKPETAVTLSDQGLPLRPGQSVCSHFRRYGICKFGPSCKYDHSVGGTAASSDGSDQGHPVQFTCFADEYGEWEMEPMGSS